MAMQTKRSDPASKLLFSHPRVAADLIRLLGGDWVDDLDLDRLDQRPTEHVAETSKPGAPICAGGRPSSPARAAAPG